MSPGTIASDIFSLDFGGKCQTIAILLSNFTDFVFYRPKKTAVLEEIGYA